MNSIDSVQLDSRSENSDETVSTNGSATSFSQVHLPDRTFNTARVLFKNRKNTSLKVQCNTKPQLLKLLQQAKQAISVHSSKNESIELRPSEPFFSTNERAEKEWRPSKALMVPIEKTPIKSPTQSPKPKKRSKSQGDKSTKSKPSTSETKITKKHRSLSVPLTATIEKETISFRRPCSIKDARLQALLSNEKFHQRSKNSGSSTKRKNKSNKRADADQTKKVERDGKKKKIKDEPEEKNEIKPLKKPKRRYIPRTDGKRYRKCLLHSINKDPPKKETKKEFKLTKTVTVPFTFQEREIKFLQRKLMQIKMGENKRYEIKKWARPPTVLKKKPFKIKPATITRTTPITIKFQTEERHEKWQKYIKEFNSRQQQLEIEKLRKEQIELRNFRKKLIPKISTLPYRKLGITPKKAPFISQFRILREQSAKMYTPFSGKQKKEDKDPEPAKQILDKIKQTGKNVKNLNTKNPSDKNNKIENAKKISNVGKKIENVKPPANSHKKLISGNTEGINTRKPSTAKTEGLHLKRRFPSPKSTKRNISVIKDEGDGLSQGRNTARQPPFVPKRTNSPIKSPTVLKT